MFSLVCAPSSKSSGVCIQPRVTAETRTIKKKKKGQGRGHLERERAEGQDIGDMKRKMRNVERALIVRREDNTEE